MIMPILARRWVRALLPGCEGFAGTGGSQTMTARPLDNSASQQTAFLDPVEDILK